MDPNREAPAWAARPRPRRRVGTGILRGVLVLILLVALYEAFAPIYALLFAPWAIDLGGRPTLTGTWVGPMRSRWGSAYHLYLDLRWEPPRARSSRRGRVSSRGTLVGEARICNPAGKEFRLEVRGDADRDAQDVRVDADARESQYRESLPLRGAWDGGETLRLSAFTSPFGPEGELRGGRSTVTSTTTDAAGHLVELYPTDLGPDRVPGDSFPDVTLRKGGEADHQVGCRAIQG